MQCIKCDICGNYSKVWRETKFSYWKEREIVEVKEICLDCVDILENKIKEMATESK